MASQTPFPFLPPKSTERRIDHFDEHVYTITPTTILYKFIDALCGDAGAGTLKKEAFIQRLSGSLDSIYGSDLDYIFGNVRFLSRTSSEAYAHDSMAGMLTSDQWDEVNTKDAAYRARLREFFEACGKGCVTDAVRLAVHSATSADCQVMENWRYIDNFGLGTSVGRAGIGECWAAVNLATGHHVFFLEETTEESQSAAQAYADARSNWDIRFYYARSEITVVPHKQLLGPREARLLRDMLDRMTSQDVVVTIDPNGLAVNAPLKVKAIAADSTYYQVEKVVTGNSVIADLPAPEMLAIDLDPSENWLKANSPELAPYGRFNITQEYGYYYLISGGKRSPIDEVTYGTLQADGSVRLEPTFEWYEESEQYGPWTVYEKADSPDNYPGGRQGINPTVAPALNRDGSPYQFPYASQSVYVAAKKAEVLNGGGQANQYSYRMPLQKSSLSKRAFTPDLAIAYTAPSRDSTVTTSYTSRRPRSISTEWRNTSLFAKG